MFKRNYFRALHGIYQILETLEVKAGDKVLVPAWICDEALYGYRRKDCKILFYKTDPITLRADLSSILDKIDESVKLIHIVNHFGHLQDWGEIATKLRPIGVPILEDNAYTYLSSCAQGICGTFGDFSIFSYRKVLPVANGALLISHRPLGQSRDPKAYFYWGELKRLPYVLLDLINIHFGHAIRQIYISVRHGRSKPSCKFSLSSNPFKGNQTTNPEGRSSEFNMLPIRRQSALSELLVRIYSRIYLSQIAPVMIMTYHRLSEALMGTSGIRVINPVLADGVIPQRFSILIAKNRDHVFFALRANKYDVYVWPTLPPEVVHDLDNYPDVDILGRQLLQVSTFGLSKERCAMLSERIIKLTK